MVHFVADVRAAKLAARQGVPFARAACGSIVKIRGGLTGNVEQVECGTCRAAIKAASAQAPAETPKAPPAPTASSEAAADGPPPALDFDDDLGTGLPEPSSQPGGPSDDAGGGFGLDDIDLMGLLSTLSRLEALQNSSLVIEDAAEIIKGNEPMTEDLSLADVMVEPDRKILLLLAELATSIGQADLGAQILSMPIRIVDHTVRTIDSYVHEAQALIGEGDDIPDELEVEAEARAPSLSVIEASEDADEGEEEPEDEDGQGDLESESEIGGQAEASGGE